MQSDKPPHPIQVEIDARGLSYKAASKLCKELGWKPAPGVDYFENICRGWNEPGWEFALFLSEKFTNRRVSVEAIKNYPYTRSRKRRSKVA